MVGFREWLIVKFNYGNNLSWPALILNKTFDTNIVEDIFQGKQIDDEKSKVAIDKLFQLIDEFMDERESKGLMRIFLSYDNWLKNQDWYDPDLYEQVKMCNTRGQSLKRGGQVCSRAIA